MQHNNAADTTLTPEELLDDTINGRANLGENVRKISTQWLEVSSCIPPSFFQLCELLEGMIPDIVHPLCDSVVAHIMIRNDSQNVSQSFSIHLVFHSFFSINAN